MIISNIINKAMGFGSSGRQLKIFPEDIFLVGYPKSGNTWLNFLVACLVSHNVRDVDFTTIQQIVADIYCNNAKQLYHMSRPRILKSHEPYDSRYRKMIYIVRDPRDVMISYYHHHIRLKFISDEYPIERFSQDFLHGKLDTFGSWHDHVYGWLVHRSCDSGFLLVKYERLKENIIAVMNEVASFIGVNVPPQKAELICDWVSFDNMKNLDLSRKVEKDVREGMAFVRNGNSGGWRDDSYRSVCSMIDDEWGDLMEQLDYLP